MRGTAYECEHVIATLRITPACAGNRSVRIIFMVRDRDHPRVCGEQALFAGYIGHD